MEVDSATAAAQMRQRRLRSWLRHELMTVAMALAEKLHHNSRGQTNARAGVGREMNFTATIRRRWAARVGHGNCAAGAGGAAHRGAQDRGVPLRAGRCSCAADGEPAGGGVPPPRFAHPEQVIEAPKISSSGRRSRRRRVPMVQQTAEQMVEVPTILSFSSLHGLVEQKALTFQCRIVEVFKVFARDRFPLVHPFTHLVLRMRLLLGLSHFSPKKTEVRGWVRTRGRN